MATFKEQMDYMVRLKHQLAVWEVLASYLDENFVSTDGRKQAKAIRVPGCVVEVVPEDTIVSIFQSLGYGPIHQLKTEIDMIESQEVVIITGDRKQ